MSNKNLSDSILKQIEEKEIQPKSRWVFLIKNYAIWAFAVLVLIVGGLASAVLFFRLGHTDFALYRFANKGTIGFILHNIPYIWVFLLIILIALADYDLKHTKRGYRYQLSHLVLITVTSSLLLGGLFYLVGFGKRVDNAFMRRLPVYEDLLERGRQQLWSDPDDGLLAGEILEFLSENRFQLESFSDEEWEVDYSTLGDLEKRLMPGFEVKLFGEVTEPGHFKAEQIRPWRDRFEVHPRALDRLRNERNERRLNEMRR